MSTGQRIPGTTQRLACRYLRARPDFDHAVSTRVLTGDVDRIAANTARFGSPVQPGTERFGTDR